jgi:Protein of unknown function (DUF4089)
VTRTNDKKQVLAEALLDASCSAHGLDFSAANRDAVIGNVRALIDASNTVYAFALPDEIEPANVFNAAP